MTTRTVLALVTVMGCGLVGCTSSSTSCSSDTRATWVQSAWPKFRRDLQNTGTVNSPMVFMSVSDNVGQKAVGAVFPPLLQPAKQPFAASPVINNSGDRVYIGSTDGVLYKLNATDLTADSAFQFSILNSITSTALLASLSNGIDGVFIGGGTGDLYALSGADGTLQSGSWPAAIGGFISASPTLNPTDGTVYLGSLGGLFTGVCANGVDRFTSFAVDAVQSSAASAPDGTLYFGADDRQLRAITATGLFDWTFSASAPIVTAPVVEIDNAMEACTASMSTCPAGAQCLDDTTRSACAASSASCACIAQQCTANAPTCPQGAGCLDTATDAPCATTSPSCACKAVAAIYVADRGGRVFKVDMNGQPVAGFVPPTPAGPFSSSPALAGDHLYLGSDDGLLYAIDKNAGDRIWTFATGGAVVSSPAVVTDGTQDLIIVGSNDGNVYFIRGDDGSMAGPPIDIGAPVRSSPAIGSDGSIYIGADDGRVYAIR